MIVEQSNKEIVSFGVEKKIDCGIANNAKNYRLMYKSLYSDPIKAIIREICINARDSHVENGNPDKQFDVHIPNWTSNLFKVRDYGTGMPQDKIEGLFSTFGASDKEKTNAAVGFWGIGSKSPLAYTNQFNITSYVDGTKHQYTLLVNEQDIPELDYFGSAPTNEPNGFEVSFAVNSSDFNTFSTKAVDVLQHFDVKPKFLGASLALPTIKQLYEIETKDWDILTSSRTARVIMGCIPYPINFALLNSRFASMSSLSLTIRLPIGSVDVTGSRESLEYTKKTIATLESYLDIVKSELVKKVQLEVDGCTTYWGSCIKMSELANNKYFQIVRNDLVWKHTKIITIVNIKSLLKAYDPYAPKTGKGASGKPSSWAWCFNQCSNREKWFPSDPSINSRLYFVVNDTGSERKGFNKVAYFASLHGNKVIYVYEPDGDYSNFYKLVDDKVHIKKVSELQDPPVDYGHEKTYINRIRGMINTFNINYTPNAYTYDSKDVHSEKVTRISLDDKQEHVYINIHRKEITDIDSGAFLNALFILNKPITIHGIKNADYA